MENFESAGGAPILLMVLGGLSPQDLMMHTCSNHLGEQLMQRGTSS